MVGNNYNLLMEKYGNEKFSMLSMTLLSKLYGKVYLTNNICSVLTESLS